MVTHHRRGRIVLVIDADADDLARSISYVQRRIIAMEKPTAKVHWWPRFLRWWCGVEPHA